MATDKAKIFNLALARIGDDLITNPDGVARGAEVCRVFYDIILDELLRSYPWNFATKRAALALAAAAPIGYSYAYTLPDDCLAVRHLLDEDGNIKDGPDDADSYDWEVESGELLTDLEDACIAYTRDVPDLNDFDAVFVSVLAARLAAEAVVSIKPRDGKKQQQLWAMYEGILAQAKYNDAKECKKNPAPKNAYVDARKTVVIEDDS